MTAAASDVRQALRYCEGVTRHRARNFWYGIRLLPPAKRQALAAVYALARRIDDVGDGPLPAGEKDAILDRIQESLAGVAPESPDPVLSALGVAARRFPLPLDAFGELIDGVRMDVGGHNYGAFADLELYCRRVAGSIGRLSLGVFGSKRPEADEALADDLGVAMQLTNIIRDVREDQGRGRMYLPEEDLDRFGVTATALAGPPTQPARALVRFEAARAQEWFGRGLRLLPDLDRRSAACAGAMAGIYVRLLGRIHDAPEEPLIRRVSLPGWEKGWVAARALVRAPA